MSSVFQGVNKAQTFESGSFFPCATAKYRLRVSRCLVKETQKIGLVFIAELEVLESTHPDMPAGVTGTYMIKLANKVTAYPNLKAFGQACMGTDGDVEKALDLATGEEQAFAGILLDAETNPHTTKEGKQFTRFKFEPAPDA
jgi:hypothetical protein